MFFCVPPCDGSKYARRKREAPLKPQFSSSRNTGPRPDTVVYTNAAFSYAEDALSEMSVGTPVDDTTPFLLSSMSNPSEDLLRAAKRSDVETVLNICWEPEEEVARKSTGPINPPLEPSFSQSKPINPDRTLKKEYRDSVRELESRSAYVDSYNSQAQTTYSTDSSPDPCMSEWSLPQASTSSKTMHRFMYSTCESNLHSDVPDTPSSGEWDSATSVTFTATMRNRTLQARIDATRVGSIQRMDRDVLLNDPEAVIESLVGIMLSKKSSVRHRNAAADLLSWFSAHPSAAMRSDLVRKVLEGAVSVAMESTAEVRHTGLRTIRNLVEANQHDYPRAIAEVVEFPWLLTAELDLESAIYLCQIFTIIADKIEACSEYSWLGNGALEAPKYVLSWIMEILSDTRTSSRDTQEYILPCLLATLTRFVSVDMIEDFTAGGAAALKSIVLVINEAVARQPTYACCKSCVALVTQIIRCSESSAMREIILQTLLSSGIVGSLFEILGSGIPMCQSKAMKALLKLQAWDALTLSLLIGYEEINHLSVALDCRHNKLVISATLFIQKVWYQRMFLFGNSIIQKLIGLVGHKDSAVKAVAVCTLVRMVALESNSKEVSRVIVKDITHFQPMLTDKKWAGMHCKLVVELLIQFLGSGLTQLEKPTILMLHKNIHKLDLEDEMSKMLFGSMCKLFSKCFTARDTELACILFDTLGFVGRTQPEFVALRIIRHIHDTTQVWDLFDHVHLQLPLRTLRGFGRVLTQLRKVEIQTFLVKHRMAQAKA